MDKSVLGFLLPQWDGSAYAGVQMVFALLFVALVIALPMMLKRTARPEHWARRLDALSAGQTDQSGQPLQLTPQQLSDAIATGPERWAAVLPGLVLIAGLLGSFIGLGLALGDTAGALSAQQPVGALGAVIDALGVKFRIAVWGLLAYLVLKISYLLADHDQARLRWSVTALRHQQAQAAQQQAQRQSDEQQRLIDAIRDSGKALLAAQQAEAQRAHVRHAELLDAVRRQSARQN